MLSVRLPFTEKARNFGLSNVGITDSATLGNDGKFGKCYTFNGSSNYLSLTKLNFSTILKSEFNISFWLFNKDTANNTIIAGNYNSSCNFYIAKTSSNILRVWLSGIGNCDATNVTIPNQRWIHISISKSTSKLNIYLDGILKNSISITNSSIDPLTGTDTFTIGKHNNTSTLKYLNGYLNDFRIYDEAIGTKEIKILANGLIVNYKLSKCGNPNILSFNNIEPVPDKLGNIRMTVNTTYGGIYFKSSLFTKGTQYAISYKLQKISGSLTNIGGHSDAFTVSSFKIDGVEKTNYHNPSANNIPNDSQIHTIVVIGTYHGDSGDQNFYIQPNRTLTTSVTVNIFNMKVETYSTNTPWCPNTNDAIFTKLGYLDGIEYDCSGFMNNGQIFNASITYSCDTKRNLGSYIFNGSSDRITRSISAFTDRIFSVSCWCKAKVTSSNYMYILGLNNTGDASDCKFGLAIKSNTFYFIVNGTETSSSSCTINTWYHLCLTYDGGTARFYINGTEVKNISNTSIMTKTNLCIGAKATGANTSNMFFNGCISDFRLYTTCLSKEDVGILYNTPISISNDSTLFTQGELIEN